MRACGRADQVVRGLDVGDPVADRLVHRVLQRPRAGADRDHLGAQHAHPHDVGALAADVLLAHVDMALEAEPGAHRGRGDAVLAGAGLGDDPALAQPPGQQRLADRVVDLVGAGVVQILALQPDPHARRQLHHALGQVERRRPADEVAAEALDVGQVGGIGLRRLPAGDQLVQGAHHRLRHEPAAELAEAAPCVGHLGEPSCRLLRVADKPGDQCVILDARATPRRRAPCPRPRGARRRPPPRRCRGRATRPAARARAPRPHATSGRAASRGRAATRAPGRAAPARRPAARPAARRGIRG